MTRACVLVHVDADNDEERVVAAALKSKDWVSVDGIRKLDIAMLSGLLDSSVVANLRNENQTQKVEILRKEAMIQKLQDENKALMKIISNAKMTLGM